MRENTKKYNRILRLIILFWCCFFAGNLSGCGKRESGILTEKYAAEGFALGELSWEQGFGWTYRAYAEKAAKEPEKIMQACTDDGAAWKTEGCFAADRRMQTQERVEIMRSSMSQEALLTHINALSETLFLCNTSVNCVMAGDTAIAQLIRVDADEEHWLYLQQGEVVYALYGFMAEESWQAFLEDLLFGAELKWDGEAVCGNRGELPAGGGGKEEPELCKYFLYDEFRIYLADSRVLSCQHDEEGFSLKLERDKGEEGEEGDEKRTEVCEFWMQAGISLPDCGTEADYLLYFEENYPAMSYYRVDLKSWKPGEEADYNDVWRQIEDSEGKYAFFYRDGVPCAAGILGEDFIGAVGKLKRQSDYDMNYGYWQREENGDIYCQDALGGFLEYIEQEVNGERLIITITDIDDREDRQDEEIHDNMEVSVRKEGEAEPFQVFYIWKSASRYALPSYFEDINADGYQDLIVVNTFGSANLNAATFLWLPSEGRFLEDTGVLDFYSGYYVDAINRRIHVHTHGSAVCGGWDAYQWTGESGYEQIKSFSYNGDSLERVEVRIVQYENGRQEVWMDCAYDREGFWDELYEDIYNSYEWDCVWEQEITNEKTGKQFTLRYLEIRSWDAAYGGYYYEGGLFVYDEDARLTYVGYSDFISSLSGITMGNLKDSFPTMEYDEEGLILHYEGGGEWGIPWEGLINE